MVPAECPVCGHKYEFLIDPRPRMHAAARLTMVIGAMVTLGCIGLVFCLPLPAGLRTVSAWTLLLYALPAAVLPIAATLFIASRFPPVVDLKCKYCQHVEAVTNL